MEITKQVYQVHYSGYNVTPFTFQHALAVHGITQSYENTWNHAFHFQSFR